jgi:hypothetical protein
MQIWKLREMRKGDALCVVMLKILYNIQTIKMFRNEEVERTVSEQKMAYC